MLAPMQGLTNRAMRAVQSEIGRPDVLFTEYVRVSAVSRKRVCASDQRESRPVAGQPPLVVQLIGHTPSALAAAAQLVQEQGVRHVNLNMGCPFGRSASGATGGAMLAAAETIPQCLRAIRQVVSGSFSVKVRSGYEDPEQIFSLLPVFEETGIDFLVLHPRTVVQKYDGAADHAITRRVVQQTVLPVIANGDVWNADQGRTLLARSGAAGLMTGRGAIADPWLFLRLRGECPDMPSPGERCREIRHYLGQLTLAYDELFCGEQQVLAKLKNVVEFFPDSCAKNWFKALRKSRSLAQFREVLADFPVREIE
ncbi:MAG: tRNA-dihydrouridine synthase family protein [Desulfuromonadaceae bacterium]|nr:tRNA-dihydrouridine synthase family protein [Desulfuromonadaceae bacterium]